MENRITFLICNILFFFGGTSVFVFAADSYVPLVGIPNLPKEAGSMGLPEYINALYLLTIGVGTLVAVIKISIAGVKWAMSDVVTDKSSAKSDIKGALLGLAILLLPFLVLSTIYAPLTNLDVLQTAPKVDLTKGKGTTGSVNPTAPGTVVEPCSYTVKQESDPSGMGVITTYDATACKQSCAAKNGTFADVGGTRSTCTYVKPG